MSIIPHSFTIATITAGIFLATTPLPTRAEQTIYCSSDNYRYNFCRVNTRGGVRLERQLSDSRCKQRKDWGYDDDGIWVDNGCKASFVVGSSHHHEHKKGDNTGAIVGGVVALAAIGVIIAATSDSSDNQKKTETKEITCSSNGEYNRCNVDTKNGVLLTRQLSEASCWEGHTWGYDNNAIWVDKGCRAVFIVNSGS